ncbi:hypothetical protein HPB51_014891 [Rhipicephalus microplus]|uniref:Uncharacterized protein n=1 Tax=Rhipicephalus microplus TaxID=6941 RepID=A0A9J6EU17_RHIMP|nr:hypothetical protein HPB51_014891 [Rhipicephalus microplus]
MRQLQAALARLAGRAGTLYQNRIQTNPDLALAKNVASSFWSNTIPAAPHSPMADGRLLQIWEAYHAVHRRWQTQKHNRHLRLRLARLALDMEEHCSSLLRQQWGQTCGRMAGNLGLCNTWSLLRMLLDPTYTKASQCKNVSNLLHSSSLTDPAFLVTLRDHYLCTDPHPPLLAYSDFPNSDLDANISLAEIRAALLKLRTTSAPEVDRITNKALRNLVALLSLSPLTISVQDHDLIRRIANHHHGMRKHDLGRLVQVNLLSRFVHFQPYLFHSRTEEEKVNCLIRQAYKSALSLPTSTSRDRLLSTGVHNSLTEHKEAHRTALLIRLSRARPGHVLSSTLKLYPLLPPPISLPIPSHVSSLIAMDPLPKNMHPEHHPYRRVARASTLWRYAARCENARRLLEGRTQQLHESGAMFAENMVRLCHRTDPNMPEAQKLSHVMRGVEEQLFVSLVNNPPTTVDESTREPTAIERALRNGTDSLIARPPAHLKVPPHLQQTTSFVYAT